MEVKKIVAPDDAIYVSEFMTDFPDGILNKKETGVGNTHLAIINEENYIIAVPTIELILNKCHQHPDLIGIYGDIKQKQFLSMLGTKKNPIKIMVTYNSLPKLVTWLGNDVYEDYKLMIDEYHTMLQDYSFKDACIDKLIEVSLRFKHKTFVSATPIATTYVPKELSHLDNYEIVWNNVSKIKPIRHKTNKPFLAATNIIREYKANNYEVEINTHTGVHISKEAYFFVNSVKSIKDIIDNAGLLPNEVKIICADSEINRQVLDEFGIDKVSDPNKPFTFITSKSFLGSDFYSETGVAYVISSTSKQNTLYSISSDVFQIAGRIRTKTNPFKQYIYHIYNTSASDLTREEFEVIVEKKKQDTLVQISLYNKLSDKDKAALKKRMSMDLEDDYIIYNHTTNELEYNEMKQLNEDFKFKIIYETYTNGLSVRNAYLDAGFEDSGEIFTNEKDDFLSKASSINFKTGLKEYCSIIDSKESNPLFEKRLAYLKAMFPDIEAMVDKLGTSAIRTAKYTLKNIKELMYSNSNEATSATREGISEIFKVGETYSLKDAKIELQKIYDRLKISKKAKATDLEEYFKVKVSSKRADGKTIQTIGLQKL